MTVETLAAALEREHHEIDEGISEFVSRLGAGETRVEALSKALDALKRHIYLEEAFLFPPMRHGGLMAPIFVMIREHGQMWRLMDDLLQQASAGGDAAILRDICDQLTGSLEAHNFKEERVIYPQADASLSPEATAELHQFLGTGSMPAGWVCQGAAGP